MILNHYKYLMYKEEQKVRIAAKRSVVYASVPLFLHHKWKKIRLNLFQLIIVRVDGRNMMKMYSGINIY